MGCDIHFYVEKRINEKWETADKWYPDEDDGSMSTSKWDKNFTRKAGPLYDGRSYDLFSILADVRNGSGFAGVDTGDGFIPIDSPRGLPEDPSTEVLEASDDYGSDGHSHSWLTVTELMDYDWTKTTKKRGWVSPKEFARFYLKGKPDGWSGGISGGGVEHVSNEAMLAHISGGKPAFTWQDFHKMEEVRGGKYTQVEWEIPYYEAAANFLSETLPQLWQIGKPDEVRIVFWFDN